MREDGAERRAALQPPEMVVWSAGISHEGGRPPPSSSGLVQILLLANKVPCSLSLCLTAPRWGGRARGRGTLSHVGEYAGYLALDNEAGRPVALVVFEGGRREMKSHEPNGGDLWGFGVSTKAATRSSRAKLGGDRRVGLLCAGVLEPLAAADGTRAGCGWVGDHGMDAVRAGRSVDARVRGSRAVVTSYT